MRIVLLVTLCCVSNTYADDVPLRTRIDERLALPPGLPSLKCADAEFLRRVSLDLAGMPPTADEARAFIADPSSDKRERLVARLIESPHYARHTATALDVMLMERRTNQHVTQDDWAAMLLDAVRHNKPWNVLARELLLADGDDPATRPAARFILDRGAESNLLARDIGRIFFGRDLQCAQCHDHPIVQTYLQSDYHGLLAFVAPTYTVSRKEGDKDITIVAERAGSDLQFESVFVKGTQHRTGARLFDAVAIDELFHFPGEEYEVAPADATKSIPRFSRRTRLAEQATGGENRAFNENIVNRLWAHVFGRGLVHPLDMHHPDNPAADPELLRLLAKHFVKTNFDVRAFLQELVLTDTYQRPFDAPTDFQPAATLASEQIPRFEQDRSSLADAVAAARTDLEAPMATWREAEAALLPIAAEFDTARTQYADAEKKLSEAKAAAAAAAGQLTARQAFADQLGQALAGVQQAATALPADAELAAVLQTLTARTTTVTNEVTALQQAATEKNTAVQAPQDAVTAARPVLEAAVAKMKPLQDAVSQAETIVVQHRTSMAEAIHALAAADARLATLRRVGAFAGSQAEVATAEQAIVAAEQHHQQAIMAITAAETRVVESQRQLTSAKKMLATATTAADTAQTEHRNHMETVTSVAAAIDAADAAHKRLPDNPVLADAAARLKTVADELNTALGEQKKTLDELLTAKQAATEMSTAMQQQLTVRQSELVTRQQAVPVALQALTAARDASLATKARYDEAEAEITGRWSRDFTLAPLKPLTPEQLCWTIFRVTGVYDRYWQAEVAELDKTATLTDEQKQDAGVIAARNRDLEQRTFDKLKGNVGTFVQLYGASAGQPQGDFFATADQALFAANGGSINSWVAPAGDNVSDRMNRETDALRAAEELYLSLLTRMPTGTEVNEVAAHLASRPTDRAIAVQELVWGVLNSAEFRFNH